MLKILVIRFSSIGDIVLTTPVVRCLKQQLPENEIHYLTKCNFEILLKNNPYIDRLWLLKDHFNDLLEDLKKENFDYIIDLHHNLRTLKVKKALNVKAFSFNKINFEKWLLVNFKINILPPVHIVDRYFESIRLLDVHNDDAGLNYFISTEDHVKPEDLGLKDSDKITAFAIGAQHPTKKLPVHKIIEFCRVLTGKIVLLGGEEDARAGEEVRSHFPDKVISVCGKFNLNQSASIISQSILVFTHDTGLMHIAAAFKKRVFSFWGSTVPEFGMYPYKTEFLVIEQPDLYCRPCSKIGYKQCPLGHFKCMNDLQLT